tara:strand:+ start:436 stop:972 length:537 start_codon:yes stop_codon:yes gene_type:complete
MELQLIRDKLVDYENSIIKAYIECYNKRNSHYIEVDKIISSMDFYMDEKYHFAFNDLMYYYYDNIVINEENRDDDKMVDKEKELFNLIIERILLGEEVIKAKIKIDSEKYTELIKNKDTDAIFLLLENKEVEKRILDRLRVKEIEGYTLPIRKKIVELYEKFIIPYTKKIQIVYCLFS